MPSRALEIVARQRDLASGQREVDPSPGRIDGHDRAAVAVDDAERAVVATHHDAVADRERRARDRHLLGTERARGTHQRMRPPVEVVDVDAALRDHHRAVEIARRPPVRHQALAQRVGVLADDDPARVARSAEPPRAPRRSRTSRSAVALPLGDLPAVLARARSPAADPCSARNAPPAPIAAQLAVVADEHELDVEPARPARPAGRARGSGSMPASSTHEHRRGAAASTSGWRSSAWSSDATLVLGMPAPSSSSRAARRATAAPQHPAAARLPRLARRAERERLARPRLARGRRATPSPSSVSRRTISRCSSTSVGRRASARSTACGRATRRARAAALDGELEDRVARARAAPASSRSARAATVAITRPSLELAATSRRSPATSANGARRAQELVGEALDVGRS